MLHCAVSHSEASESRWRGFSLTCPVDPEILVRFSGMSWHRVKAGCQYIFLRWRRASVQLEKAQEKG